MNKKTNLESINMDELKEKMQEIKEAATKAKAEQAEKEAKGEIEKQPLGKK